MSINFSLEGRTAVVTGASKGIGESIAMSLLAAGADVICFQRGPFPLDDYDRVMDINSRAVFQLCTGFGKSMVEHRDGKIVNIASLLSFQGGFRVPAYAASKGAVAQLTKAFANEWASVGVNVNAVAPGYVVTEMNDTLLADSERNAQITARIPAGRWAQPDDITGAVVFLASHAADYIHGITIPVDGGWLGR